MPVGDMLVQLLKVEKADGVVEQLRGEGVVVKRASSYEMSPVVEFVEGIWGKVWGDEVRIGFGRQPVSVFVALREGEVVGFCAYEVTRRNYVGPMGVVEKEKGKGVGKALLLSALDAMLEMGYAYAIIGGVGPVGFYEKACGATLIENSGSGIYTDRIKGK